MIWQITQGEIMKRKIILVFVTLLAASGLSGYALASDHVVIVKGGDFTLSDRSQVVDVFPSTITATFTEKNSLFGVEYDHVFDNGFSIGGGIEAFNMDYTTNQPGNGEVDVTFFMFNGKYYFSGSNIKPFVGASAGFALTDFTGDVLGNTIGFAAAVSAGIRFQFSLVGIYLEYKNHFSANTEDTLEADVDVAGDGVYAGLSFQF